MSAEEQFQFSCSACNRPFRGTEHSIRGLIARGATCSYCRGPYEFPSQFVDAPTTGAPIANAPIANAPIAEVPAASATPSSSCPQCRAATNPAWISCPYCGLDFSKVPVPPPRSEVPDPSAGPLPEVSEAAAHGVMGEQFNPPPSAGVADPGMIDAPTRKPPQPTPASPPPQSTTAPSQKDAPRERIEAVDNIIRRSKNAQDHTEVWVREVKPALLQAEILAVIGAYLFLHSFKYSPLDGITFGLGLTGALFVAGQLFRMMRAGQIGIYQGKGFFLRSLMGPLMLLVAVGGILSPIHRWANRVIPQAFKPRIMGVTAVVSLVLVGILHAMHDPFGRLEIILEEVVAKAPKRPRFQLQPGTWVGSFYTGSDAKTLEDMGMGDTLSGLGLGIEEMSMSIETIDGNRFEGRLSFPNAKTRLHIKGLHSANVLVFVADDVLSGIGQPNWPMNFPVGAAYQKGVIEPVPPGPAFKVEAPEEQPLPDLQ